MPDRLRGQCRGGEFGWTYHSGIGYHHPADVHNGTATTTVKKRQAVLDQAYQAHPNRFRNKPPTAPALPTEAWINKPTIHTTP